MLCLVYDKFDVKDGYVSLEVLLYILDDIDVMIVEVWKLWGMVDWLNLMIKILGMFVGVLVILIVILEGINVNVMLLFLIDVYVCVVEVYVVGLEKCVVDGYLIDWIVSVVSFFVSWIDLMIDKVIDMCLE